ncbi:hypothetical protein Q4Q35_19525 [Flavivirga aquimarina]|uniref:Uncharacterized protein n=1 Tax=Flavivirga aquimarina TaxID=2027862 RepID=A0ABT8WFR9_9FLAO|nr:hypothetical protein [Flavivirga aquimarina]MDO5971998.1 hypothetical protein [Flavivirga aquimarina]
MSILNFEQLHAWSCNQHPQGYTENLKTKSMIKNKINISRRTLILTHDTLSNSLTLLINQTSLKDDVKKHCRLGLKVFGIILADLKYDTGTHLLMEKEFDLFFARFPAKYYNEKRENRKWVCVYTVAKNIESCIRANAIVNTTEDKPESNLI